MNRPILDLIDDLATKDDNSWYWLRKCRRWQLINMVLSILGLVGSACVLKQYMMWFSPIQFNVTIPHMLALLLIWRFLCHGVTHHDAFWATVSQGKMTLKQKYDLTFTLALGRVIHPCILWLFGWILTFFI